MRDRDVVADPAPLLVHAGQRRFVLVAQVGGEADLPRDDVARAGMGVDLAHGPPSVRLVGVGDVDHGLQQEAGGEQGVAADRHGGRACMHFHAGHRDVVPAQAERAGHHAYGFFFVFQDRALLDVRFEVGVHRPSAHRVGARVADGLELVAHADSLRVARGERGFKREFASEYAGPHHDGHEARAFFIGPDGHLQRGFGLHPRIV
ncbi:hypothetical protein D3C86_1234500 [compost metagenome]